MNQISKEFHFSASHTLHGLPNDHKCSNMHGHNYIVIVELRGELDDTGFVKDYGDLYPIKNWIDDVLDHAHLCRDKAEAEAVFELMKLLRGNEFEQRTFILGANTSAENLAKAIFTRFKTDFPQLKTVKVSETPKTWAEYGVQ